MKCPKWIKWIFKHGWIKITRKDKGVMVGARFPWPNRKKR